MPAGGEEPEVSRLHPGCENADPEGHGPEPGAKAVLRSRPVSDRK